MLQESFFYFFNNRNLEKHACQNTVAMETSHVGSDMSYQNVAR